MSQHIPALNTQAVLLICKLGVDTQHLLAKCIDYRLLSDAKSLQAIDKQLLQLLTQHKMLGNSTHYIWRTRGDDKVRLSHAENADQMFAWDNPPSTGHPGEDYNCRCWAQPLNANSYANQVLLTPINDNPVKWTDVDFILHYFNGNGASLTLSEVGWLGDVIKHYSETLGVYDRINQQIIDKAIKEGPSNFIYSFVNSYSFDGISLSIGDSIVGGLFIGEARKEEKHLVISGYITYQFFDYFTDLLQLIELFDLIPGIDREDIPEEIGNVTNIVGDPYATTDHWQTKFNATVSLS